jgi:hypothetical protein
VVFIRMEVKSMEQRKDAQKKGNAPAPAKEQKRK